MMGEKKAWDNRTAIYLGAAAGAEFVADVFLCPLEACRIRSVSDPTFAPSLAGVAGRLIKEEGMIRGFYSGFGPILFKQIPYTMAKFAVQGLAAEKMYGAMGKEPKQLSGTMNMCVSLASGTIAGVVAAIISHPADTLLSKVNKKGAGGDGSNKYCARVIAMQPLMVEPTGSVPKRNMLKTLLLGALALVGVVCLFQSGAVGTNLVGHHGLAGEV